MSSGIIHAKLTKQISIPSSILISLFILPITGLIGSILSFIFIILGFLTQLWLNPDCDQFGIVTSEWWIIKKFSILGWWFVGLFDPYARIIPRHRHFLSHGIFIGTLGRIIYIFILLCIFSIFIPMIKEFLYLTYLNWDLVLYWSIGLFIGDCGHILLDFNNNFRDWYESL